jgi:DNA-binding IscR family transcriptional regulator
MRISDGKKDKIAEQILAYLYSISPKAEFTKKIAEEIARDEEFTKKLLINLEKKGLVSKINKNKEGIIYIKRLRWKISDKAYIAYKNFN